MKIEVTKLKRYNSPDSSTKAFVNLSLTSNDSTMYLENLTIKEIVKDGKKKLIVSYPSYKSGESYREIIAIKGQLYWDINNTVIEQYVMSLEEAIKNQEN